MNREERRVLFWRSRACWFFAHICQVCVRLCRWKQYKWIGLSGWEIFILHWTAHFRSSLENSRFAVFNPKSSVINPRAAKWTVDKVTTKFGNRSAYGTNSCIFRASDTTSDRISLQILYGCSAFIRCVIMLCECHQHVSTCFLITVMRFAHREGKEILTKRPAHNAPDVAWFTKSSVFLTHLMP